MHEPERSPVVAAFGALASRCKSTVHRVVTDVAAADCVLFVDLHLCPDPSLRALLSHPLVAQFRNKALVYDERDEPWCALPGVYVSMPRRHFDAARQHAFGYYAATDATAVDPGVEPDLLFSFVGTPGHRTSGGHAVRQSVLQLRHPRAVIEDSSGFVFYDDQGNPGSHRRRQRHFAETMGRSKFVLCPRGRGTSSIRMYETLRAGRVPVILADEWVAPSGPDWNALSLTVPERDVATVPGLIEANEPRWAEMAKAARAAYDTWFAPEVAVGHIFDLCARLLAQPAPAKPRWRDPGYRAMRVRTVQQQARRFVGATLRAAHLKS